MRIPRLVKRVGLIGVAATLVLIAAALAAHAEYYNPAVPGKDSAAFWMDRGGMLATYGNYAAAVKAYEKALTLAPSNSEIQFDMGVAYGEMGDYTQAMAHIDKAVMLAPENGRYHYGRGRVLLMLGMPESAMGEFKKAADLGNADAQAFLKR